MEKFIPYEKLSKRKKRELDAGRRTLWAISPVTRRTENPKAYNRKKAQKWKDDSASVLSFAIECRGNLRRVRRFRSAGYQPAQNDLLRACPKAVQRREPMLSDQRF